MADTYSSKGFTLSLGLFIGLLALYAVLQSPLFVLRSVELVGANRLTSEEILFEAGLRPGTNLFSIDLRRAAHLLAQHPLVEEVNLRRKIPGTLVVTVRERRPVAYLAAAQTLWMIDRRAIPLLATTAPTESLPLITVSLPLSVQAGVPIDSPLLRSALEFTGALPSDTRVALSEVSVADGGLTAFTRDGVTISLGDGGDMAQKAEVLSGLLDQMRERNLSVSHIDLRHPRSPVFRQR